MSETLEVIRRRDWTSRKKKIIYVQILTHNPVVVKFGPLLKFDGPGQMLLLGSAGATHSGWPSQAWVGIPNGITDVFALHNLCNRFWCSSSLSSSFLLMLFYAAVGMTNSILRGAKGKKLGQEMDTCVIKKNPKFRGIEVFLHPFCALMLLWAELTIIFEHRKFKFSFMCPLQQRNFSAGCKRSRSCGKISILGRYFQQKWEVKWRQGYYCLKPHSKSHPEKEMSSREITQPELRKQELNFYTWGPFPLELQT